MRLFPLNSSGDQEDGGINDALLYLNVYDLTPANDYVYWLGVGIFHSGIEAHGMEYAYGAHEYPTSGLFEVEPRSCPGFIFRQSILLGSMDLSPTEFQSFMEHLSDKYHGDDYHLVAKNCNHFTDEVSMRLTGKPIPGWVNRVAKVASFCNCLLPEHMQLTAVRHIPDHATYYGSDSGDSSLTFASEGEEEEEEEVEDVDRQLLTAPISEVAFLRDKPVTLAKDLL